MRERLDCAVLLTRCTLGWIEPILGQHAGGRLHLHGYDIVVDLDTDGAHAVLGGASMALRRYDACLLPVSPSTLSWARTSLSQAHPRLHTPVMALVRDLTATGLYDLYGLGVADFLRSPFCGHETRVRVERLLDGRRTAAASTHSGVADGALGTVRYAGADPAFDGATAGPPDASGPELEAYAIAAASRCASSRETFRDAKSKVVERFERAYITAALGRHAGNIAMAARAAQKHRRAFWALMRKHQIDAAPFRLREAGTGVPVDSRPRAPECRDITRQHRPGSAANRLPGRRGGAGPFPAREG